MLLNVMSVKCLFVTVLALFMTVAASAQKYDYPQNSGFPIADGFDEDPALRIYDGGIFANEAGIAYGFLPVNDFQTLIHKLFPSVTGISSVGMLGTGSVCIYGLFNLNSPLFVGAALAYSGNMGVVAGETGSYVYRNFFSLLPQFKYVWFVSDNALLRLYSRCALGVTLLNIRSQDEGVMRNRVTTVSVAFQLSPVGFEIGRSVAGFVETGFGAAGVVSFGVRTRF